MVGRKVAMAAELANLVEEGFRVVRFFPDRLGLENETLKLTYKRNLQLEVPFNTFCNRLGLQRKDIRFERVSVLPQFGSQSFSGSERIADVVENGIVEVYWPPPTNKKDQKKGKHDDADDDYNDIHKNAKGNAAAYDGQVHQKNSGFQPSQQRGFESSTVHVRQLGFLLHFNKSLRSNLRTVSASIQSKMCKAGHPEISSKSEKINMEFDANRKTLEIPNFMNWMEAISVENGYVSDNTAVVGADIHVECVKGIHVEDQMKAFEKSEKHLTDVVLVVSGAKKILAGQSEYFMKRFYEKEVGGTEYLIDDEEESQFVDFLNLIYRTSLEIDGKVTILPPFGHRTAFNRFLALSRFAQKRHGHGHHVANPGPPCNFGMMPVPFQPYKKVYGELQDKFNTYLAVSAVFFASSFATAIYTNLFAFEEAIRPPQSCLNRQ